MSLSKRELSRYSRHIKLIKVGLKGQEDLKKASVLVIGAGGLGCSVLQYITAAGVGTIGILDGDVVEESNLQRQVLFGQEDVGKQKAKTAAHKLKTQNPNVKFKVANEPINKKNCLNSIALFDIVVDCTDNFPTRYLINDACVLQNKTLVFGAIHQFEGQVSVFNYNSGPSYRCLFPDVDLEIPNCSDAGVLGVLPGIIGNFQANEVLKIILGIGDILSGKLLSFNSLNYESSLIEFNKTEEANITELGTYDFTCISDFDINSKSISSLQLKELMNKGVKLRLLDVREYFEWDICHIEGSDNIPMNLIDECIEEIDKNVSTVVICHHGVRSQNVIHYLEVKGFDRLINLEGGIHSWASNVDLSMPTY